MKLFGFIKKTLFAEVTISSSINLLDVTLLSATSLRAASLKCSSTTNHECKVRPEIVNVNSDDPVFNPISITQVNAAVVVITFLILLKTLMLKC